MPRRTVPEPLVEKIGQRIEDLRAEQGSTMEMVAIRCQMSKGHLSNIERGLASPTAPTFLQIAGGLGERLFALFLFPKEHPLDRLADKIRHLPAKHRRAVEQEVDRLLRKP